MPTYTRRATRGLTVLLLVLLAAALLGLCAVTMLWLLDRDALSGSRLETAQLTERVEALEAGLEASHITYEELEHWMTECSYGSELMQRFYDDRIIYPEGNRLTWQLIDESLPQNGYDFGQIERLTGGELAHPDAIKGIDVSEFQGEIDWERVKADGVEFAILRAGYRGHGTGKLVADKLFADNLEGARAAGVKVGAYLFSQAIDEEEAREEAQFLLEQCGDVELDYPLVLDIEDATGPNGRTLGMSQEQFTAVALAFADEIRSAGGQPMIYANTRWLLTLLSLEELYAADCPIWLAQYVRYPFYPYQVELLQYSHSGRVDGIVGNVDLNLHFGG